MDDPYTREQVHAEAAGLTPRSVEPSTFDPAERGHEPPARLQHPPRRRKAGPAALSDEGFRS